MRFRKFIAPVLAVLLVAGCDQGLADLEVENLNDPDTRRVLANPGDVVGLIGGAYRTWFLVAHSYYGHSAALSVASDAHSASWGNFGMKDISVQPRIPIDNTPSYSYAYVFEVPWSRSYSALKAVNDGLRAANGDLGDPVDLGADEQMARAWAHFVQGLSHGMLAMTYDSAYIFDETIGPDEISEGIPLVAYDSVMRAAINQLQKAIDIADANDFTTPDGWVNGVAITDEMLSQLGHSYIARYMTQWPRTPAEAANVDWNGVISHADQGITADFGPFGDGFNQWFDGLKSYGGVYSGWARLDLRFLGMGDQSGEYQTWMGTTPADRMPFLISTKDTRVGTTAGDEDGEYVQYFSSIPFRPERGTYHFSNYGDMRWSSDSECDDDVDPCDGAAFSNYAFTFVTQMVDITPEELDFLKAEAHIMNGNPALAVPIINNTRTANGLAPVTTAGVPASGDCVPREPNASGDCGDLMTALHWEKWLETWHTGAGNEFADARRWGFLISGTPLHFPIPGAELQILGRDIYTYGGGESPANEAP